MKKFVHGKKRSSGTFYPGFVRAGDNTVLFYALPLHCTREAIDGNPKYAVQLKALDRLVEIMNEHASELQELIGPELK